MTAHILASIDNPNHDSSMIPKSWLFLIVLVAFAFPTATDVHAQDFAIVSKEPSPTISLGECKVEIRPRDK